MLVVVLAQYAVGMVVNLFVTIPAHRPGAKPSNYISGSGSSVAWAIANGPAALAVHAALGLALAVAAIVAAVLAAYLRRPSMIALAWLGEACIIGVGFNGASFLDFNHDVSSLIMSLLAAAAIACYALILFALPVAAATIRVCPTVHVPSRRRLNRPSVFGCASSQPFAAAVGDRSFSTRSPTVRIRLGDI
jgi:hypothetical protein